MGKACTECPWISKAERNNEALAIPGIREAAANGEWFCCHVHLGQCQGAVLWGKSMHANPYRKNKAVA